MESLTTPRLVLPAWEERFAADLTRMSSNPRIMRHLGHGIWTAEYAAQRHADALEHWARHGFGWRAILDRADGAFLGLASLGWLRDRVVGVGEPALEIGWWTEPHTWGKGVATEAASAVIAEAFERVRAPLVVARCDPGNAASERVMVKLGMTRLPHDATGIYGKPVRVHVLRKPQKTH
ncbi:GNAT family N-acetyltransferase [Spirillospora sp. CA-294931]|uniref:GNAT family N-acetyltransferase n=1 Tax=Spirillospora sp. CA-294931 TaxID=3240042 RepID=UPI003D8AF4B3